MKFHQLAEIDPGEIVVPFSNAKVVSLWAENEYWKELVAFFGRY